MSRKKVRKNNTWDNLSGFRYAHRGLFHQPLSASVKRPVPAGQPLWKADIARWKEEGKRIVPENSMEAFRMAVKHGFGIELDVHVTKDGTLPVFHDTNLFRVCGVDRIIEDLTREEIRDLRLLDTEAGVPELHEVLELFTSEKAASDRADGRPAFRGSGISGADGGTGFVPGAGKSDAEKPEPLCLPLIIELKAEKNAKRLCTAVMETVDRYPALNYCIESFDPRVVYWLRKNRPDVIRGQLTENFCRSREAVRQWGHVLTFGMWCGAPDILSRPDFISSRFRDRKNIIMRLRRRLGVKQVNWTIKNSGQMKAVDREGGLSIFERFMPRDGS